ncbi:hypothetical protein TNCV_1909891 [Trichonephila clavipes]|nr:hypothetical protein TNCV_1909891 [Trichonephila clavipes]
MVNMLHRLEKGCPTQIGWWANSQDPIRKMGRVLCEFLKTYMCASCVLNTPSNEKVASSQNNDIIE